MQEPVRRARAPLFEDPALLHPPHEEGFLTVTGRPLLARGWEGRLWIRLPDDAIQPSATLAGLLAAYNVLPDIEMLGRYSLTESA